MADATTNSATSVPSPATHTITYNNPRGMPPENSITPKRHSMTRAASMRNAPHASITTSPRRNPSNESHPTGSSDSYRWFDRYNHQDTAFDISMDVDPLLFQKESDSPDESVNAVTRQAITFMNTLDASNGPSCPSLTHQDSNGGCRSIVDNLTVENRKLRGELNRLRQMGPDSLRREKLFEVEIHGLPSYRKRELEAALRAFTTSLNVSGVGQHAQRKKSKSMLHRANSSISKHACSAPGSNDGPGAALPGSAYASNSTFQTSSNPLLPGKLSRHPPDQIVGQLPDIPEGLWPRSFLLTENDKQRLVVRRLEEIFTGKGPTTPHLLLPPDIDENVQMSTPERNLDPTKRRTREAPMLQYPRRKERHSPDNGPASNSNEDQTDSRLTGNGSSGGSNDVSPPSETQPEQRPTRLRELDPDRPQVPTENMQYIHRLGISCSKQQQWTATGFLDADRWIYVNLLSNLAQLHLLNVTPAFIRTAVTQKSQKLQLSSDGHKIRWRGGDEGAKLSSDGRSASSPHESTSDDTDGSSDLDRRKKLKARSSDAPGIASYVSNIGHSMPNSPAAGFHYKPLFKHQQSSDSDKQSSADDEAASSYGLPEESTQGHIDISSGVFQRKRRRDGAIIYYAGAPFCVDLSGDCRDIVPDSDCESNISSRRVDLTRPEFKRTASGSSVPFKPLSDLASHHAMMDFDFAPPGLTPDTEDDVEDMDVNFPWSESTQSSYLTDFEASGLGGITPHDHFLVVVSTRRPKRPDGPWLKLKPQQSEKLIESKAMADFDVLPLATMNTRSPSWEFVQYEDRPAVDIEYLSGEVRRMPPVPLPPPAFHRHAPLPLSEDEMSDCTSEGNTSDEPSEASRQSVVLHPKPPPANEDITVSHDSQDAEPVHAWFERNGEWSPNSAVEAPTPQ